MGASTHASSPDGSVLGKNLEKNKGNYRSQLTIPHSNETVCEL